MIQSISDQFKTPIIELENAFQTGFKNAAGSGPLCEEPMVGTCFIIQ